MLKRILLLGIGIGAAAACEPTERAPGTADDDAAAVDSVGPAAYAERLLFLPLSAREAPSILFDFGARVDSAGVERSMRAWTAVSGAWTVLDTARWRTAPMREPWRLLPHGRLRLIVDADGELETLVHRAEPDPLRLLAGETLGEWSPAQNARLRIRRAELVGPDGPRSGVLLDAHFRLTADDPPPDSVGAAYLTDGRGTHFVLIAGMVDDGAGWMREGGRSESWRGVRIVPTAFRPAPTDSAADASTPDGADASRSLPTAWRIEADDATLSGRLELVGAADDAGLFAVQGTLDVDGREFPVHGIVRRGAA